MTVEVIGSNEILERADGRLYEADRLMVDWMRRTGDRTTNKVVTSPRTSSRKLGARGAAPSSGIVIIVVADANSTRRAYACASDVAPADLITSSLRLVSIARESRECTRCHA
jgi:hypothetical protein